MRILMINETCGTGSIGRLSLELLRELESRGHECCFAHSVEGFPYHHSYKIGTNRDHKIHALLSRITGLQGYYSIRATRKLVAFLKQYKPDIVHLQNLHSNYINLRILFEYLAANDIATVLTLHDSWFYTGKCTYYVPAKCEKWQAQCGKCPLLHRDNVNKTYFFDRTKKALADKNKYYSAVPRMAVTGVSKWVSDEVKQSILKNRKIVTIYNWVDKEVFKPRVTQLRSRLKCDDKVVLLMVNANICYKKGYQEMIQLARRLPERYQLVVVGRNKDHLQLPDNIIHLEHTNNAEELAEYYTMADICVNTTKYETFGMVTAEAMYCGTPVIVYNNTASPELIGEGCGIVVDETQGVNGIISAIKQIEGFDQEETSKRCVEFARKMFDKKGKAEQYLKLYEELCEENSGQEN